MAKNKQSYKYIIANSIIYQQEDEYKLSQDDFYVLYSFYVTYSCCGNQSMKRRTIEEYGWNSFSRKKGVKTPDPSKYLKDALAEIINLDDKDHFIFTEDGDDISKCMTKVDLADGILTDYETERCICMRNSENNRFLNLSYRIRDGFAHGKFLLKISESGKKCVVIQDDDGHSVTARIVLKLDTLLRMVKIVDKNSLITSGERVVSLC